MIHSVEGTCFASEVECKSANKNLINDDPCCRVFHLVEPATSQHNQNYQNLGKRDTRNVTYHHYKMATGANEQNQHYKMATSVLYNKPF